MNKRTIILLSGFVSLVSGLQAQFDGAGMYDDVKKYVSLGEHRTGTTTDSATSDWLAGKLRSFGFDVHFQAFPIRQFFPEKSFLAGAKDTISAYPLWWVNEEKAHPVSGILVPAADIRSPARSIALIHLPLRGRGAEGYTAFLDSMASTGVAGIVAVTDNLSNEIQQYNTAWKGKPWKVPVILVAPKDSALVNKFVAQASQVVLSIRGSFRDVTARNVYGTVGHGNRYIVVSTPISGWFTCGGERGSGLAVWLALARWASQQQSKYTFVFTGNSGHEHAFTGAHLFLESNAPPPDKTQLWLHLGAGAATRKYMGSAGRLVPQNTADEKRRFFYSSGVADAFQKSFGAVAGEKIQEDENPGGELVYVARKGYRRFAGITYVHPFFHVPTDDASTTTPDILQSTATAFKNFLQEEIR